MIAVDVNPANLAMAKKLGAHEIIQIESRRLKGVGTPTEASGKTKDYESDPKVIEKIMELTYGKGVDVSMEMAGPFSSINNAIDATRRGGDVILFGLKDGDLTIPKFSRVIVRGLTIHNIIGRRIFRTWQIAQRVLSDKTNGIQDAIWNVILKKGKGTILRFQDFTPKKFEKAMSENPKILFKING